MCYMCPKSRHEKGFCIFFERKISFAIINVNCKYPRLNSFSLPCSIPLFALLLHLASYYLLLSVVWSPSSRPPFLALWFCSGDFISLFIVPAD